MGELTEQVKRQAARLRGTMARAEDAERDLRFALGTLVACINGERDLASAAEWVRKNHPDMAQKLKERA